MAGADNEGARSPPAVLIVEDEWLIALDLVDEVVAAGYEVVGPAHSVSTALDLLASRGADGALLDVNLKSETSYPIAAVLIARSIPFMFLTGYASGQLRPEFHEVPLLNKPVKGHELRLRLGQMLPLG
jgi:DNA-binding response OmpR family regulator